MITKGAVEEILNICTHVEHNNQTFPITKDIKNNVKKIAKSLNSEGLRVVAVCKKENIDKTLVYEEKNMVLIGFIGFLDPPKESAKEAIEKLNNSGIRVIVLTGDNLEVTKCICNKVNLKSKRIVSGNQIDSLSDIALTRL